MYVHHEHVTANGGQYPLILRMQHLPYQFLCGFHIRIYQLSCKSVQPLTRKSEQVHDTFDASISAVLLTPIQKFTSIDRALYPEVSRHISLMPSTLDRGMVCACTVSFTGINQRSTVISDSLIISLVHSFRGPAFIIGR